MLDLVDRLGTVWLDGALGALVLFGIVAIAMVLCGQPARRCIMARSALLGSLLIVPWVASSPLPTFRIRVPFARLAAPRDAQGAFPRTLAIGGIEPPWRLGLVTVALSGVMTGLGLVIVGWRGGVRYVRKTVEPAPETSRLYEQLSFPSGRKRPDLRVSARVRAPILIGCWRQTILIPPDLDEPGEVDALRLGLLHELVHAERRDSLFGLASAMAGAIWFPIPPLWWMRRQMRLDQEFLADHVASDRFGARAVYATSLVGMAQLQETQTGEGWMTNSTSGLGGAALLPRVLMLVRCPFPVETTLPPWWRRITVLAIAALTLMVSSLSMQGPSTPFVGLIRDTRSPRPRHGVLQMARLSVEAPSPTSDGHPRPYSLLTRLPDRFELLVDVWGSSVDLQNTAIIGRFLDEQREGKSDAGRPTGFHRVRLVRSNEELALWVDGRPVPPQPRDRSLPEFLCFQPAPGQSGRYRNLVLSW